jgi:hypothetical protein
MEDLQAAAGDVVAERERDAPQPRGELLVRQPGEEQFPPHVGHVGDGRGADRPPQDADSPLSDLELLALVAQRERGVQPLVVLGGGVADRHLRNGHVVQRDVGDRAVEAADPHQHSLGSIAVAALDREVHIVRHRVDRHVPDHDIAGLTAQERADPRVDVLEVERLGRARRARVRDIDGEHLRRDIVGQEQDAGRPERDRPGRPEIRHASPQSKLTHRTSSCRAATHAHLVAVSKLLDLWRAQEALGRSARASDPAGCPAGRAPSRVPGGQGTQPGARRQGTSPW